MPVRMLHLADLHLGYAAPFLPASLAGAWREERDRRLEHAVGWALQQPRRPDLVVVAGDLFDRPDPEPALAWRTMAALRRLVDAGLAVVTVSGGHDEWTDPSSVYRRYGCEWPGLLIREPDPSAFGPLLVGGEKVYLYGAAFTGGWRPASRPITQLPPRSAREGIHVGLFHARLTGLSAGMPEAGPASDRALWIDGAALAGAGYDYVALGCVHRYLTISLGRTLAVYPGPVDGRSFDDPGTGHYVVVDLQEGEPPRLRREAVPVRPLLSVSIRAGVQGLSSARTIASHLQARLGAVRPVLRLVLTGDGEVGAALDAGELKALLAPACFYLEIEDRTCPVDERRLASLASREDALGRLAASALETWREKGSADRLPVLQDAWRLAAGALEDALP
ncbi:metallophosphoesterase [Carboxydochorda subterranea]|uniref:Metallophosphoesterase n=1 Tax=Carboxydichorda subterranea TaxID=3109565 RepID=A0ABZ1BV53_9FIRM|nr:metallophosphoesterase [Limnochorda sp. L945t]WRP16652.1 metallophosphoesterase [Limnochorda sp. L945t]